MSTITHQHRQATVVAADDAGEFRMQLLVPFAADRVLSAIRMAEDARRILADAASAYRGQYAATGMIGGKDGSPGRIGSGMSPIERMGDDEMRAWRAHNRARSAMTPWAAIEVDRVVIHEYDLRPNHRLIVSGLSALARHYGLCRRRN